MIKQIFLDMDGTLLNSQGQVSAQNAQTIINSQIPVTLVSARAPLEMADAIHKLRLSSLQVAFNGGLIFKPTNRGNQVLVSHPIQPANAQRLLNWIAEHFSNVSLSCYDAEHWYAFKMDTGVQYEMSLTHIQPTLISDPVKLNDQQSIYKIMLIVDSAAQMTSLKQALAELHIAGVNIQQSGWQYLEITSQAAIKSAGITYVLQQNKLTPAETAAFGDGHNDLPMLQQVGLPIVMGNALPDIQQAGRFITKTNDEDGVAYGIDHFMQIPAELRRTVNGDN